MNFRHSEVHSPAKPMTKRHSGWIEFGKQLRNCRVIARISQQELGDILGKSASLISKVEVGAHHPNQELANALIEVLRQRGVPDQELDELQRWHAPETLRAALADVAVSKNQTLHYISKVFQDPDIAPHEREMLGDDLERVIRAWKLLWVAEKSLVHSDWKHARQKYEDAVAALRPIGIGLHINVLSGLAKVQRYEGAVGAAVEHLATAEKMAEGQGEASNAKRAEINEQLGNIYRRQGKWEKSLAAYETSLCIYNDIRNEKQVATLHRKLTGLWLFRGEPAKALVHAKNSFEICERLGYRKGIWRLWQQEAWAYGMLGQLDKSLDLHAKAIEMAMELHEEARELAKAYRYAADADRIAGRTEISRTRYLQALELLTQAVRRVGVDEELLIRGTIFLGLGSLQVDQKNFGEALTLLEKSLLINTRADDKFRQGQTHIQLGRLYMGLREYPQADYHFQQATQIFGEDGSAPNPYHLAETLLNQSHRYLETHRSSEISKWKKAAESAMQLSKQYGFRRFIVRADLLVAQIILKSNSAEIEAVVDRYTDALQVALELDETFIEQVIGDVKLQVEESAKNREKSWGRQFIAGLRNGLRANSPNRNGKHRQILRHMEDEFKHWETGILAPTLPHS